MTAARFQTGQQSSGILHINVHLFLFHVCRYLTRGQSQNLPALWNLRETNCYVFLFSFKFQCRQKFNKPETWNRNPESQPHHSISCSILPEEWHLFKFPNAVPPEMVWWGMLYMTSHQILRATIRVTRLLSRTATVSLVSKGSFFASQWTVKGFCVFVSLSSVSSICKKALTLKQI